MEMNPLFDQNSGEKPHNNLIPGLDETVSWEYRLFVRDLELDNAPDEEELDPIGAEGWELVGIFVHANMLYCYFKRQK